MYIFETPADFWPNFEQEFANNINKANHVKFCFTYKLGHIVCWLVSLTSLCNYNFSTNAKNCLSCWKLFKNHFYKKCQI